MEDSSFANIVINEILSHVGPTSFDDIHTILRREFLIAEDTINDCIRFLQNSRFVELEQAGEFCVQPIACLRPKQVAPTAPYSVFVPHNNKLVNNLVRSNDVD